MHAQRNSQRMVVGKTDKKGGSSELTSKDIQFLLSGKRVRLDCGHRCTVGHNFANTLIIYSLGGGRVETWCHSCH